MMTDSTSQIRNVAQNEMEKDRWLAELAGEIATLPNITTDRVYQILRRAISSVCDSGCVHTPKCNEEYRRWAMAGRR